MPRSRALPAALLVAAASFVASAEAAAPFAQASDLPRGGGFYLSYLKLIPVILIYLLWVATTQWANNDADKTKDEAFPMWNSILFFTGVVGLLFALLVPVYVVGIIVLFLAWLVPLLVYVGHRNALVEYPDRVLTAFHFGELANMALVAMRQKPVFNKGEPEFGEGPPVNFIAKKRLEKSEDKQRAQDTANTPYVLSAKDLLYDAHLQRASEIRLDLNAEALNVRYSVDGVVMAAEPFDPESGAGILETLRVVSGMDPNERRKIQEGSFSSKIEDVNYDYRVVAAGSKAGEKMVLRVLDRDHCPKTLEDAGMRSKMVERVKELVNADRGLFIVAGAPGSGRTTVLYACIRELDRYMKNIMTLEDPVEYLMDNIGQNEFDPRGDKTFPEILNSLIKQDPDVLVIGELKDKETIDVACQAVNRGRMVLSTVDAPDAVSAVAVLRDLGADPRLLANYLNGVVSQRLVRVLDESCKEAWEPTPEQLKKLNIPPDKVEFFYRPPSDPQLIPPGSHDGYLGRTGIFQLLEINDTLRELVAQENLSVSALNNEARKAGMNTFQEDGLRLVVQGKTSIEEIRRALDAEAAKKRAAGA